MSIKATILILLAGAVALCLTAASVVGFNIWSAEHKTLVHQPSAVDEGRTNLHGELVQAGNREAEIEKQEWNSPVQLQGLIESHKQRMTEMGDNPEGKELVAHDQQAIDRLSKRITEIYVEREAAAERQAEQASEAADEGEQQPQQPAQP
ncbi:hypothetical protein ACOBR2_13645 [Telmatobacter bradus]|uniref:hypothetical protein n=1 Tax=Telmatobacter bradus TaxID=474953 RepID=UPI003B43984D